MTRAWATLRANKTVVVMTTDAIEEPAAIDGTALVIEHRDWINAIIRRRVDSRHVADEICQDVCVAVLQQANRPNVDAKIRPWLFQIVTRRIADHYRRQYRETARQDELRDTLEPPVDRESWQWLAAAEQSEAVEKALATLDDDDRTILRVKFREEWTYEQIAEHFSCTVRSAEHRLIRAKSRLRSLLGDVE